MTEINPLISELFIFNEKTEENVLSFSEILNFQVIVVDLSQILVGYLSTLLRHCSIYSLY
jgi:hypothetical protein